MFRAKLPPFAGRLFGVKENQIGGQLSPRKVTSGAEFKKFVRRNDQMPVPALLSNPSRSLRNRASMPNSFNPAAIQIPDFVEEIVALRNWCKARTVSVLRVDWESVNS